MGTPVIASRGAPWKGLESHQCGWWVDADTDKLASAMMQAMSIGSRERRCMGERGRVWVEQEFTWAAISSEMLQVYQWLLGSAERPSHVHVD